MEEIKVTVCKYPDRANLVLRYVDPVSGQQKTKPAGTPDESAAIGKAAVWQDELRTGRYQAPSRLTWAEFRKRYEAEKGAGQSPKTLQTFRSAANHLERVLNPDRLAKLTPAILSRFQAKLREEGTAETTIGVDSPSLASGAILGRCNGHVAGGPKMAIPRNGNARARAVAAKSLTACCWRSPRCGRTIRRRGFATSAGCILAGCDWRRVLPSVGR